MKLLNRVQLFVTPWTVTYQASPPMGFSRQECLSGLPFPSPVDLPDPGIEPGSPALQADALPSEPPYALIYDVNFSLCSSRLFFPSSLLLFCLIYLFGRTLPPYFFVSDVSSGAQKSFDYLYP